MNNDELKELLRLTAIALGEGWQVVTVNSPERLALHREGEGLYKPHELDADSRWLECELLIDVFQGYELVIAEGLVHETMYTVEVSLADHNNDRLAATRWAVLKCAAEIGAAKEEEK